MFIARFFRAKPPPERGARMRRRAEAKIGGWM
jgi:hypothetical protein